MGSVRYGITYLGRWDLYDITDLGRWDLFDITDLGQSQEAGGHVM